MGDPLKTRDAWFGYPTCFTVWEPSSFPNSGLKTGSHFVMAPNSTFNDASCNKDAIPPRLSFQAHSAPIWNTFDNDAKNMYVTFVSTAFPLLEARRDVNHPTKARFLEQKPRHGLQGRPDPLHQAG